MSEFGRIHAFAVTNRNGNVLYERFYDHLSEIQKAEMRTAMGQCSRDVSRMSNGQVGVGNFRGATIVFQPLEALVYFSVGSGEYDELTMLTVVQTIIGCLKAALKSDRAPSEASIVAKYDKLCVVLDEVIHEGVVDTVAAEEVLASIKMA